MALRRWCGEPVLELDHLTAIVQDSGATTRALERVLGAPAEDEFELPGMSIRTLRVGGVEIHVNAPTGPGPVREFFNRHGAGLHHLALRVVDLDAKLAALAAISIPALGTPIETAPGLREVFLDPAHTGGLLIQLVERRAHVAAKNLHRDATAELVRQAGT